MHVPVQLLFMSSLLVASVAGAQAPSYKPMDADLTTYQYPYPIQFITLNIQGETLKMAYMDVQPANPNGHVVMLLHGKNFSGFYWAQTIAALTENGYRVIVPDQVGFGKSSKPQHLQYSFQLLCQNTKAILDSLGIQKIFLLGYSMGGMIASRFSLMYPDLVSE